MDRSPRAYWMASKIPRPQRLWLLVMGTSPTESLHPWSPVSINSGAGRPNHSWVGGHSSGHVSESIPRFSKTVWTVHQPKWWSIWNIVRGLRQLYTLFSSLYCKVFGPSTCMYLYYIYRNLCSIKYQHLIIHQDLWLTLYLWRVCHSVSMSERKRLSGILSIGKFWLQNCRSSRSGLENVRRYLSSFPLRRPWPIVLG